MKHLSLVAILCLFSSLSAQAHEPEHGLIELTPDLVGQIHNEALDYVITRIEMRRDEIPIEEMKESESMDAMMRRLAVDFLAKRTGASRQDVRFMYDAIVNGSGQHFLTKEEENFNDDLLKILKKGNDLNRILIDISELKKACSGSEEQPYLRMCIQASVAENSARYWLDRNPDADAKRRRGNGILAADAIGAGAGAALGAAGGAFVGGIGAGPGALLGGLFGAVGGSLFQWSRSRGG